MKRPRWKVTFLKTGEVEYYAVLRNITVHHTYNELMCCVGNIHNGISSQGCYENSAIRVERVSIVSAMRTEGDNLATVPQVIDA